MGLIQVPSDTPISINTGVKTIQFSSKKKKKTCLKEGKTYKVRTSWIIGDCLLFASKNHALKVLSIVDTPKCNVPPYIIISFEWWYIRTTKDEVLSIISDSSHIKNIKKKKRA